MSPRRTSAAKGCRAKGELAQTALKQRAVLEGELARRGKVLVSWQQKRDAARTRYFEKDPAREDALEHAVQQHRAAQERYDEAQRLLAAIPKKVPIDAMLDAGNELQRMLNEGGAPVNERLKRVFSSLRIGWADEDTIAVLPVLRPDVIETHAAPDGRVLVFGSDWRTDPDSVSLLDGGSPETRVMLVVPPPSKLIEVSLIGQIDNAWARQGLSSSLSEGLPARAGSRLAQHARVSRSVPAR